MKIYIIGPSGSGKTTFAKTLATKYNTKHYELDVLVFDDKNNHVKRSDEEIDNLFNQILKKSSWIIEDVGRTRFKKGRENADKIYYLKIPKRKVYTRVIKRWIRQKLKKEAYNYPPTLKQLMDALKITNSYFRKEHLKLEFLKQYQEKIEYLNPKEIKKCVTK